MTPTELSEKSGISLGYASMLLSGDRTTCSVAIALKIYEATGLQFGILKDLTPEQIEPLRKAAA